MSKPPQYDSESFYGLALPHPKLIPNLICKIRHGAKDGMAYASLIYLDNQGIKWRIEPSLTGEGQVQHFMLQQRNRTGQAGFHAQCFRAAPTPDGLRAIIQYIKQVELLTAGK